MNIKKTVRKIHLWLGLISGSVVFVVALTGAIYAFQEEIQYASQEYRFTDSDPKGHLAPSELIRIADKANPGKDVHAVMYHKKGYSAKVVYYNFANGYYDFVYLNPNSGEVLEVHDVRNSFFGFILEGHFYLWLPPQIGQPIVAISCLIFLLMLITGLILWWPKNKKNRLQKLTIRWDARWRRKNYDLHSVLGFYVFAFGFIFAVTGLVWGFKWFRNTYYSIASGGESYVSYYEPESAPADSSKGVPIDRVWLEMRNRYPDAEWIEIHTPYDDTHVIAANANPDASTYWKTEYAYFDQATLEEKSVEHHYGKMKDASTADKLMRMNYDIHVGGIFGITGKIIMCLASLLIASLPVTGFLIWWGRRNKA